MVSFSPLTPLTPTFCAAIVERSKKSCNVELARGREKMMSQIL